MVVEEGEDLEGLRILSEIIAGGNPNVIRMIQASPEPEQRVDLGGDGETVNSQEQPLWSSPSLFQPTGHRH